MRLFSQWIVLAALLGGCGGQYVLTVPDQFAPAKGETTPVVRLQRNDFFVLDLPVKGAAMRFRLADGPLRGAYTDALGYAGANLAAPAEPGRHELSVDHMDFEGDEVGRKGRVYVRPSDARLVAVDVECLPPPGHKDADAAAAALRKLASNGGVLYMTRESPDRHGRIHDRLDLSEYPDGPVLLWQREAWHVVREGRFNLPRVVIESRLVSQLGELKKAFPKLAVAVCQTALAARAFSAAGLQCVILEGGPTFGRAPADRKLSWSELAETWR